MSLSNIYLGAVETIDKAYLGNTVVFTRGGGYDAATQALLDQASTDGYTAASGTALTALDAFIVALKADGIWTLLDALWLPATNGDSDFACYNLKDPTSFNLTKVNSPTFTSLEGFTGNGASAYLDTNFNLSVDGVNYTLNAASIGFYNRLSSGSSKLEMGAKDVSNFESQMTSNWNGSGLKFLGQLNDNNNFTNTTSGNETGFHILNRLNNDQTYYNNGLSITTDTDAPSGVPNETMGILGRLSSSMLSFPSSDQISFAFIGGDLSTKASEFYTAIQDYMIAIGKQV